MRVFAGEYLLDRIPENHHEKEQIDRYDPVQIGWSGQIKEFREENFYGETGEYHHRHISHLVALMPGTLITRDTPAWLDAAKVSGSEGWMALIRIKNSNRDAKRYENNCVLGVWFPEC